MRNENEEGADKIMELKEALGRYAPAPNAVKESWTTDLEGNTGNWDRWLSEGEAAGRYTVPAEQAVWTEGEIAKAFRETLKALPKNVLAPRGKYDRIMKPFPETAYLNRSRTENVGQMGEVLEVTETVSAILRETLGGEKALSQACREAGMEYIRFRRFCEKFLQVRNGGRSERIALPKYEGTFEEKFYAMVFSVREDEAYRVMPEDAEETVQYVLGKLGEREREVLLRRIDGETLESIAAGYGLTRERVRQIEAKALRELHRADKVRALTIGSAGIASDEAEVAEIRRRAEEDRKRLREKYALMTIEELNPSVRAYNCMKRAGIRTVGELISKTPDELRKIRGLGIHSLVEIKELLGNLGLELSEDK